MPRRKQTKGICAFCGKAGSKRGATSHLSSCAQRKGAIAQAEEKATKPETLYHLRVQDAYDPSFWLNLEMRGSNPSRIWISIYERFGLNAVDT